MEVNRLRLRPNDVIVLSTDLVLSQQQCDELKGRMEDRFPGHKVVIITQGVKLSIVEIAA